MKIMLLLKNSIHGSYQVYKESLLIQRGKKFSQWKEGVKGKQRSLQEESPPESPVRTGTVSVFKGRAWELVIPATHYLNPGSLDLEDKAACSGMWMFSKCSRTHLYFWPALNHHMEVHLGEAVYSRIRWDKLAVRVRRYKSQRRGKVIRWSRPLVAPVFLPLHLCHGYVQEPVFRAGDAA